MATTDVAAAALQAILNGVWQGAALTMISAVFVRAVRVSAATRHAIWTLTLLAVVVVPCLSAVRSLPARRARGWFVSGGAPVADATTSGSAPEQAPTAARPAPPAHAAGGSAGPLAPFTLSSAWTLLLVAAIGASSALRTLRVFAAVFALRRLAARCRPLDDHRESALARWSARRLSTRRVRLSVSPDVPTPVLIGLVAPVIALPERLLPELSDLELDQVALHELAHLHRRDDWSALAENLVAAFFFFQPAVHWITRRLEREREMACDEWVVAATGARSLYAACLLRLGEWVSAELASSLAPSAAARKAELSHRIEALVNAAGRPQLRLSRAALCAALASLSAAVAGLASTSPAVTVLARSAEGPVTATDPVTDESLRADTVFSIGRDDTGGEDPETRRIALAALDGRAGSVIVMDVETGRALTIVNQDWAVRRGFSPASTIKLVTGIAALRARTLDPDVKVAIEFPRRAQVGFEQAIAVSSNDYFLAAGEHLGFERFLACARELGLGEPTGVALPNEYAGRLPEKGGWSASSGAGFEVTPIQLAMLVSAIANGGDLLTPLHAAPPVAPKVRRRVEIPEEVLERIHAAMVAAVADGTGWRARQSGRTVAGKTGTWKEGDLSTGIFVSFAPAEHPALAVVALLRGKDELGATAAALAGRIYAALPNDSQEKH